MWILTGMLCVPLLGGCNDGKKKLAKRDQQAAQILALDAEISALERDMNREVPDVSDKLAEALAEEQEIGDALAKREAGLTKSMADQRAAAEGFDAYRKKHVTLEP